MYRFIKKSINRKNIHVIPVIGISIAIVLANTIARLQSANALYRSAEAQRSCAETLSSYVHNTPVYSLIP